MPNVSEHFFDIAVRTFDLPADYKDQIGEHGPSTAITAISVSHKNIKANFATSGF